MVYMWVRSEELITWRLLAYTGQEKKEEEPTSVSGISSDLKSSALHTWEWVRPTFVWELQPSV